MARRARLKSVGGGGWYHVYAKAAAVRGDFPLQGKGAQGKLVSLVRHFSRAYFCEVAGFCVMGNHYHAVVRFEAAREVSSEELRRRADIIYPKRSEMLDEWPQEKWERFAKRLFDVSELMRNVQAAFGRWYNGTFEREGSFWGGRFKSTLLENEQAAFDCLTYIDLNPVRAGIVERPEEYEWSSLRSREIGDDKWLLPLSELTGQSRKQAALREYKATVYYRGSVATKEGQGSIPERVVRREEARGFRSSGAFAKRLRHMVDGLALGSEEFIRAQLERLREEGSYLRRKHPIPPKAGPHLALREQRGEGR